MYHKQVSDGHHFKDVNVRNVLNIQNTMPAKSVNLLGIKLIKGGCVNRTLQEGSLPKILWFLLQ